VATTRLEDVESEAFCYLTTTGRRSGRPHTIEIWFALRDGTLYMLSGGGDHSDWVRNLLASPQVSVRITDRTLTGRARTVTDPTEDGLARDLLVDKYQPGYGGDLTGWRERALPIAVDMNPRT
jgi:deazaflavin-dependent oxidoreductase (nitroreductase family)